MLDGIILYWAANRVTVYWKNFTLAMPCLLPVSLFELLGRDLEYYNALKSFLLFGSLVYIAFCLLPSERGMVVQFIRSVRRKAL